MLHDLTATLAADKAPSPTLVFVFLRGGADGLHLVPPVEDDAYYKARPTIGVKKNDALRLDDMFGLHPDLASLLPIYRSGELPSSTSAAPPRNRVPTLKPKTISTTAA